MILLQIKEINFMTFKIMFYSRKISIQMKTNSLWNCCTNQFQRIRRFKQEIKQSEVMFIVTMQLCACELSQKSCVRVNGADVNRPYSLQTIAKIFLNFVSQRGWTYKKLFKSNNCLEEKKTTDFVKFSYSQAFDRNEWFKNRRDSRSVAVFSERTRWSCAKT